MTSWTRQPSPVRQLTHGPDQHFFGYYGRCPWSPCGRWLLTLRVAADQPLRIQPDHASQLLLIDTRGRQPDRVLATTTAWNWQQGAQARWVGPADRPAIVFNARDPDGRGFHGCRIDPATQATTRLAGPIYSVADDEHFALGLDYRRLHHTHRTVGYATPKPPPARGAPDDDGLWRLSLNPTTAPRLLVSLEKAAAVQPRRSMDDAWHWFSHPAIQPAHASADPRRVVFLHRWSADPAHQARWGFRLLTADARHGSDLRILDESPPRARPTDPKPWPKPRNISHPMWLDQDRVLCWSWPRGVGGYHIYADTPRPRARRMYPDLLDRNGHFSLHPTDPRWMVSDTYPDAAGVQTLMLIDRATHRRIDVASFGHDPAVRGATRCDLHPRWDRTGRRLCVDALTASGRQMHVVTVDGVVSGASAAAAAPSRY